MKLKKLCLALSALAASLHATPSNRIPESDWPVDNDWVWIDIDQDRNHDEIKIKPYTTPKGEEQYWVVSLQEGVSFHVFTEDSLGAKDFGEPVGDMGIFLPTSVASKDSSFYLAVRFTHYVRANNTDYIPTYIDSVPAIGWIRFTIAQGSRTYVISSYSWQVESEGKLPSGMLDKTAPEALHMGLSPNFAQEIQISEAVRFYSLIKPSNEPKPDMDGMRDEETPWTLSIYSLQPGKLLRHYPLLGQLTEGNDYTLYYAMQDAAGNLSPIGSIPFHYLDTVPPVIWEQKIVSKTDSSARFQLITDEWAYAYSLIVGPGDAVPDSLTLKNKGSRISTNGMSKTYWDLKGLEPATRYTLYMLLSNGGDTVISQSFITHDLTQPEWLSASLNAVSGDGATVQAEGTEAGSLYALALPMDAKAPIADSIMLQAPGQASATTNFSLVLKDLKPSTSYMVYAVLADTTGRLTEVKALPLTTGVMGVLSPKEGKGSMQISSPYDAAGRPQSIHREQIRPLFAPRMRTGL